MPICYWLVIPLQLRLYTSKRAFEELEVAKDDYIQANIRVHKEQKLVLPKNVESYIKEVNLSPSGLFETIELALPSYLRKKFQQPEQRKKIDWIPHNFSFRYLISSELVEWVSQVLNVRWITIKHMFELCEYVKRGYSDWQAASILWNLV